MITEGALHDGPQTCTLHMFNDILAKHFFLATSVNALYRLK